MKSMITPLFLILVAASVTCGQTTEKTLDSNEYKKAINLLFPLDGAAGPFDYAIAIRVRSSDDPEYLVRIVKRSKTIEIMILEAKQGNLSYFLSSIVKTTELEFAEELVKKVELQTATSKISSSSFSQYKAGFDREIRRILMNVVPRKSRANEADSSVTIPLHGTTYEVSFVSTDEIQWYAYDYPLAALKFDHAMVYWIKTVVQRIAKEPAFSKSAAIKSSLN